MPRMLFVCTGNVCRSPFAERYASRVVHEQAAGWHVSSAGTAAMVGADMESLMAGELAKRGGTSEGFVSRQISKDIIDSADLIVTMEIYHRSVILDDFPALVRKTYTLGQLSRLVAARPSSESGAGLIASIGQFRQRARDEDDIPDPYRRGPEAAATSARLIAEHLDTVLARLLA